MECLLSGWHRVSDFRPKYYSLSFPQFLVFIILRLYLDTDKCQCVQLNSSIASPTTKCLETASPKGQSCTAGHQISPNTPTQPGSERGSSLLKWIGLFRTDPKNHVIFQDSKQQHPYSEGMKATEPLRIPPNIPRGVTTRHERAQLRAPGSISSLSPIQNAHPCHCKRARKKLISKEKGNGAGWLRLTSNAETLLSRLHPVMA